MVTATSSGYFILARLLTLDMALTCFLTWGIALAYLAVRNQQRRYLWWAYLALGCAVLTKGPVGVVLPALIFLVWFAVHRQWRGLRQLWHPGGALVLAAVVLPWYVLVGWRNPEFWHYFFVHENLQRFLAPQVHAGQPVYFYLGVLAAGFLPWIFLLPWAWQTAATVSPPLEARRDRLFLGIWFAVIFVFFSLARAKLFPYLLPGLPPLALLLARALAGGPDAGHFHTAAWRWTLGVWFFLALLGLLALAAVAIFFPVPWQRLAPFAFYPLGYCLILALSAIALLAQPPTSSLAAACPFDQRPAAQPGTAGCLGKGGGQPVSQASGPGNQIPLACRCCFGGIPALLPGGVFLYRPALLSISDPGGVGVWVAAGAPESLLSALAGAITGIA